MEKILVFKLKLIIYRMKEKLNELKQHNILCYLTANKSKQKIREKYQQLISSWAIHFRFQT